MRVLAIRARNLTSIEHFELDLSSGPLAETRIFAITGPTGAGKSTLLDAMCLALYDRAPRLTGSRGLPVGELEVSAIDPRSLVRRGATEASAEVDFEVEDGARWRAIWEVWRARKRADGKIQDQRMRLIALADQKEHTGATKTETLAKIEALVGLGYSEFRRAVLLAQNDFASFLRAKPDERAELLERMTGTEIYAAISRAAFVRAKAEDEALARLEADRARLSTLEDDDRKTREEELATLRARRASLETELTALARAIAWSEELARLSKEVAAAEAELAAAMKAEEATEPLAIELNKTIAAERARPAYEAATRARTACAELARASGEAAMRAELARGNKQTAERQLEEAHVAVLEAKAREAALQSELEKARALDVEVREALRAEAEAKTEHDRALSERRAALDGHERLTKTIEDEQCALDAGDRALKLMRTAERLAAQWPRWKAEIDRYPSRQPCPKVQLSELTTALQTAEGAATAARTNVADARRALEEKRKVDPPRAMFDAAARLNAELASVVRLEELANETKKTIKEKSDEEARVKENAALAAKLGPEVAALETRIAALEIAEKRPALLSEGEPCPLCGSREHPSLHDPIDDRAQVVHELHAKKQALVRTAESETRSKERAAQLATAIERATAEWIDRRKTIEMLWVDSPILGRLGSNRVAMQLDLDPTAKTAQKNAKAAAAALGAHREELLRAIAADEAAGGALDQLRDAAEKAEVKTRALALELRAGEVLEVLKTALFERPGWENELAADPEKLRELLAREVESFEEKKLEQSELEEKLRARAIERERTASELKNKTDVLARAEAQHENGSARREQQRSARAELLGGKSTGEVAEELARAENTAEKTRERAQAALGKEAEQLLRAESEQAGLASRLAEEEQRAQDAEASVDREMETLEMRDRRELDALLSRGKTWIEMSERALASAHDAVARKESTLAERARKIEEHRARGALEASAELELEGAPARMEALRTHVQEAIDRAARIAHDLSGDDRARAEKIRLGEAIAEKKKIVDRWAELNLLIGSADGKKLRTFAQGLTMEALLLQANQHLEELRPRYRLRRIEGSDLELEVVDGDMGDEIRGVSTLSGGESFLVSLSLALALSTIAAKNVRIRSLFVDEGFGSLDPEAMEVALATLDRLQAEGRTIAIISHVPQIAERIGYRVHVRPVGPGTSEVIVLAN